MSIWGFAGAPARRLLTRCEDAIGQAHYAIDAAALSAPGVSSAERVRLPYEPGEAGFHSSAGSAKGGGSSREVIVDGHGLSHIQGETRRFVGQIIDGLTARLAECDDITETDLRLPKTSLAVRLVTEQLRGLLPRLEQVLVRSEELMGYYSGDMLRIGGGGDDGLTLLRDAADRVWQDTESAMSRQAAALRDQAHACRTQSMTLEGQIAGLRQTANTAMRTSRAGDGQVPDVDARDTATRQALRLQSDADDLASAARRLDAAATELEDETRQCASDYVWFADEVAKCDHYYEGQFADLAYEASLLAQVAAVGDSFCPETGAPNLSALFTGLAAIGSQTDLLAGLDATQIALLLAEMDSYEAVRALWDTLTPDLRTALIAEHPEVIGNLDGIPIMYRAQANVLNMQVELRDVEARLKALGLELRDLSR